MNEMLQLKEMSISYIKSKVQTNVLENVNLNIEKGSIVGIMGASGNGKTTLLKAIMCEDGTDMIVSGKMFYRDVCFFNDHLTNRNILHNLFFVPQMTASAISPLHKLKNIYYDFCKAKNIEKRKSLTELKKCLIKSGLTEEVIECYPYELSGGMLQRAIVSMGISLHPEILLLDEPTSALDVETQLIIMSLLKDANLGGTTILLVSHEKEFVNSLCHVIYTIKDKRIVSYECT